MPFEGKGRIKMRVRLENGITLEFDSTGMMEDFRECSRIARESGSENGKDCKTCKCDKVVGGTGLCTIPEVERALEEAVEALEEEKNG